MSYECMVCREDFYYPEDLTCHEQEEHPYCYQCSRPFFTESTLRQHMINSKQHNYCGICDRDFQNPNALKMHQIKHEPRNLKCPKCSRGFPTPSAFTKHVEVGKCYGDFTHTQYVDKIREWEVRSGNRNLLTVPRLEWSGNSTSSGRLNATAASSWTGAYYACYFCPREFGSLNSLNQHLNAGTHSNKEFRCKKCGYTAVWLSGLIEHIESEKCGFMTRGQIRDMTRPFTQFRLGN